MEAVTVRCLDEGSAGQVTDLTLSRTRQAFASMEGWAMSEAALGLPEHEVEREMEKRGREVCLLMLQAHLDRRGVGNAGLEIEVTGPDRQGNRHRRSARQDPKTITSIFGKVKVRREAYAAAGHASVHPVDEELELPKRSYSYEMQRRVVCEAVRGPYEEGVRSLEETTGNRLSKRSAEAIARETAVDFDAFYEQRSVPPSRQTGPVVVASVDGKGVRKTMPGATLVLDLIHALERLWIAAHALYAEGSRESVVWVRSHLLMMLEGNVSQVVKGMRQSATKRRLRGVRRKAIETAGAYLYRNRAYMKYGEYLAAGLPIASGAVEGACKNLVKDRMERSGMRWTEPGAEAILRLRALKLSGDLDEYLRFHIQQDQRRLYGSRSWRKVA